ncbi:unnamed protein product [Rotaria socialis]|uniref:Fibrinogen C-terminal domain-containing protein n=1 Tax=Rotaria socialis TaxID=392032 RepID=A0A820EHC7_9BILA|nr:unnamed protein product [Rotaria socialis]CAF4519601.1 unnamed protein product [Rotaria socialis]
MCTLLITTFIVVAAVGRLGYAYDLNADLSRGLVGSLSSKHRTLLEDGTSFTDFPEDYAAIYLKEQSLHNIPPPTGIYEIWPRQGKPIKVLRDMNIDGGDWAVFQKRGDYTSKEDFYRTWLEYKQGFGDLQRQFWSFSTKDQDNDAYSGSCAQLHNGVWWYYHCHNSNLNGGYLRGPHPTTDSVGVNWATFRRLYYSLKMTTEMKIRPVWFKP